MPGRGYDEGMAVIKKNASAIFDLLRKPSKESVQRALDLYKETAAFFQANLSMFSEAQKKSVEGTNQEILNLGTPLVTKYLGGGDGEAPGYDEGMAQIKQRVSMIYDLLRKPSKENLLRAQKIYQDTASFYDKYLDKFSADQKKSIEGMNQEILSMYKPLAEKYLNGSTEVSLGDMCIKCKQLKAYKLGLCDKCYSISQHGGRTEEVQMCPNHKDLKAYKMGLCEKCYYYSQQGKMCRNCKTVPVYKLSLCEKCYAKQEWCKKCKDVPAYKMSLCEKCYSNQNLCKKCKDAPAYYKLGLCEKCYAASQHPEMCPNHKDLKAYKMGLCEKCYFYSQQGELCKNCKGMKAYKLGLCDSCYAKAQKPEPVSNRDNEVKKGTASQAKPSKTANYGSLEIFLKGNLRKGN